MRTTVIIPTYNRSASLKTCLSALARQKNTAFEWEVIVINDGGEALDLIVFEKLLNIRYFYQENAGPGSARNKGVELARGQFILFTDDDCEPHSLWVSEMTTTLAPNRLVAGHTINKLKNYAGSEASQLLLDYLTGALKNTPEYFFTSNNLGIAKSDFLDLGGFDRDFYTSAGEDREFTVRAGFKGYELVKAKNAIMYHAHALSPWQFWNMHFKYGRATHIYHAVKTKRGIIFKSPLQFWFYVNLVFYPFKRMEFSRLKQYQLFAFLLVSQIATVAGYLRNRSSFKN
jgi:glycosyltransferase involved in cell wall biosynthesis